MNPLVLEGESLAQFDASAFLTAVDAADSVIVRVRQTLQMTPENAALLLASTWRRDRPLQFEFGRGGVTRKAAAGLRKALIGPLLWGSGRPQTAEFRRDEVMSREPLVSPEYRQLISFPNRFRLTSRPMFQAGVSTVFSNCRILVPESVIAAVSTILFEIASNVEEYGAYQDREGQPDAFRFMAAQVHETLDESVGPRPGRYLQEYYDYGHARVPGWLQVIVADAGPGLAFPSYAAFAESTKRANRDVHLADPAEEVQRFHFVLNTNESTKGTWGRVINKETKRGEGTKFIRFRLAAVRGYASCFSGRCQAEWWYAKTRLDSDAIAAMGGYEVSIVRDAAFRGTAWHLLIPLNPQLALGV